MDKKGNTKKTNNKKKVTTKKTTNTKKTSNVKRTNNTKKTNIKQVKNVKKSKKNSFTKIVLLVIFAVILYFIYNYFFAEKILNKKAISFGKVSIIEKSQANRSFDDYQILDKYYEYRSFISYMAVDNKLSKEDFKDTSYIITFVDDVYCDGKIKNVSLRSVYKGTANIEIKANGECNTCKDDIKLYLVPVSKEDANKIEKVDAKLIRSDKKVCEKK